MGLCESKPRPEPHPGLRVNNSTDTNRSKSTVSYKVVLIGDSGVGKSSLISQFVDKMFTEGFAMTTIDRRTGKVLIGSNIEVKMEIWDTAGQERYRTITSSFYNEANGVMVVYDITNPESFDNVPRWLQELERYAPSEIPKIIIGNKVDLEADRKVTSQQGKKFATEDCEVPHIETSAKENTNVTAAFEMLAKILHNSKKDEK
eukprot:TRINITY_DN16713_c0_g1_i2.p1 TRINITY_DN16713_c0_g1~~TRINITY_DN16713_c0_g1_i2.p1  ORF type:complete len:203 (-),score=25.63 TRINITY_DN16713_c0_g1_i2:31-639(-)